LLGQIGQEIMRGVGPAPCPEQPISIPPPANIFSLVLSFNFRASTAVS